MRAEEDDDGRWRMEDSKCDLDSSPSSIFHPPSSFLLREPCTYGITHLRGAGVAAQVAGMVFRVGNDVLASLIDGGGGFALVQEIEHHRDAEERRDRVGEVFAGDVRSAPVD